jgi:hypothetical protein
MARPFSSQGIASEIRDCRKCDLNRSGDEHFGTVTVDGYDPTGNLLFHQQGTVHATRTTVKTDLQDLF